MAELVTLTTPETKPTNPTYRVSLLLLNVEQMSIEITLLGQNGESIRKVYDAGTTPTGATLLHALNIGNFSVNSLMKAVYNRLIADGVLAGAVTGTPQ